MLLLRRTVARKRRSIFRYWLGGNEHACGCCDTPHAHAVTVHCAGCDRNFCGLCVVTIDGERLCSDCAAERSP